MTRSGPLVLRSVRLVVLASLFLHSAISFAQASDPSVQAALRESADFHKRGQLSSAFDSARKALKLAKGDCGECQRQIVHLQLEMDRPHDAASSAGAWAAHASSPAEKAEAELLQARALVLEDKQKHSDALLLRADQVLHQAATDDPHDPAIHLLEGRVLAALHKDADAKAQFAACAATPGATPLQCRRAAAYAANISLVAQDEAPEFTIAGPNGTPVTLDSLAGKVVLIDFWATWCGPCARDLDYIQSIAEEFEKDNFVLLGISTDEDETKWKVHVKDNRMIGTQVRDNAHTMQDLFHVAGIPTYLILDGNGIIRFRATGVQGDVRGKIRELLRQPLSQTAASAAYP